MLKKCKHLFIRYLSIGVAREKDRDISQQIFVSNLFSFVGYLLTLSLSINAAIKGEYILTVALATTGLLLVASHHIHNFSRITNSLAISTKIVWVSILSLMIYLVYTGGHQNTGALWIYLVPPVAFFFGGMRHGLLNLSAFIVVISTILFYPNEQLLIAQYSFEFKLRLMLSFITVSLLFGLYEYSRQKNYQHIKTLSQKFEQQAMHDPLTHLANRRGMREHLGYEFARAIRNDTSLSILLCDIDRFKHINDEFLHDGGDFILEELSLIFSRSLRSQDKVSRWGGEEFLFMLPQTSSNDAFILAEKLRNKVSNTVFNYKDKQIKITISIGISEVNKQADIDQAINRADHFLYEAKENGRNITMPKRV